jgi:hypothetical protein
MNVHFHFSCMSCNAFTGKQHGAFAYCKTGGKGSVNYNADRGVLDALSGVFSNLGKTLITKFTGKDSENWIDDGNITYLQGVQKRSNLEQHLSFKTNNFFPDNCTAVDFGIFPDAQDFSHAEDPVDEVADDAPKSVDDPPKSYSLCNIGKQNFIQNLNFIFSKTIIWVTIFKINFTKISFVAKISSYETKKIIHFNALLFSLQKGQDCHVVVELVLQAESNVRSWCYYSPDSIRLHTPFPENDPRPTLLLRLRDEHILCVKQVTATGASQIVPIGQSRIEAHFVFLSWDQFIILNPNSAIRFLHHGLNGDSFYTGYFHGIDEQHQLLRFFDLNTNRNREVDLGTIDKSTVQAVLESPVPRKRERPAAKKGPQYLRLRNAASDCFANALVQCLLSMRRVVETVRALSISDPNNAAVAELHRFASLGGFQHVAQLRTIVQAINGTPGIRNDFTIGQHDPKDFCDFLFVCVPHDFLRLFQFRTSTQITFSCGTVSVLRIF